MNKAHAHNDHVLLFQYGSNMSPDRLNGPERLNGLAKPLTAAKLDGWGVRFDLYSKTNDSAATDLILAPDEYVIGVLFAVPERALATMDRIEGVKNDGTGNYRQIYTEVSPVPGGGSVRALTYVGTAAAQERFKRLPPVRQTVKPHYFEHLLVGSRQFSFPSEYVDYLRQRAGMR